MRTIAVWMLLAAGCSASTTTESGAAGPSSGAGSGAGGSETPTTVSTGDCIDRCAVTLGKCGASDDQASQVCVGECSSASLTEDQVACFEAKGCAELAESSSLFSGCEASSGGSPTGSGKGNGAGNSNGANAKPTSLAISGSFGSSTKATHVHGDDGKIHSNINLAPAPKFSPQQPSEMPNLSKAAFTVESPALAGCKPNIGLTLNSQQVGVVITGSDALPSTACAKFTDAVASQGLKMTIKDAPYPNGGAATVTLNLTR